MFLLRLKEIRGLSVKMADVSGSFLSFWKLRLMTFLTLLLKGWNVKTKGILSSNILAKGGFRLSWRELLKPFWIAETKGAFTRCDKTDATCDKIVLCKQAYLCDMQLLYAVAGKLKSSNFLATIACHNKPVYVVRFWCMLHGRMFLSHRVNVP